MDVPKVGTVPFKPFWQTSDGNTVRLYLGEVRDVLRRMPAGSVQVAVTSPPYWGLRDYGTAEWEGGDPNCQHKGNILRTAPAGTAKQASNQGAVSVKHGNCDCGARRIDQQIGRELTPDEFVQTMVEVFREVKRVLRDDGVLWLNLGDTYAANWLSKRPEGGGGFKENDERERVTITPGFKPGNLIGIPWRVALALQADGWILRQDIIWHKPSPMPESVRNRCTKAHEYVFLFAKKQGYFYDCDAIKEKAEYGFTETPNGRPKGNRIAQSSSLWRHAGDSKEEPERDSGGEQSDRIFNPDTGRNKRSVWTISSGGYSGSHFATFPEALVEPCILAGTSEHGCCADCGAPYKRIVESVQLKRDRPNDYVKRVSEEGTGNSCANSVAGVATRTVGWEKGCECDTDEVRPCIVLDPFIGSGTTQLVSIKHGRWSWGIDLNRDYLENHAKVRIEGALMSRPALAHLSGLQPKAVDGGTTL